MSAPILTYAGVGIRVPSREIIEATNRYGLLDDIIHLVMNAPTGRALQSLARPEWSGSPRPQLGDFWKPFGASRIGVYFGLATGTDLSAIKAKMNFSLTDPDAENSPFAAFAMSANGVTITDYMGLLPPRPIVNLATSPDGPLYLLTLVDYRYRARFNSGGGPQYLPAGADWNIYLFNIALATSIDFAALPVSFPAAYGQPETDSALFYSGMEPPVVLADAAAANVGSFIYLSRGSASIPQYGIQTWEAARTAANSAYQAATSSILQGGAVFNPDLTVNDPMRQLVLPPSVTVYFPVYLLVSSAQAAADGGGYTSQTTLDGAISDSSGVLTVISAANFPNNPTYIIKIDDEYILVGDGGNGGATWTDLTRGYLGSTAASHSDGAAVDMQLAVGYYPVDSAIIGDAAFGGSDRTFYENGWAYPQSLKIQVDAHATGSVLGPGGNVDGSGLGAPYDQQTFFGTAAYFEKRIFTSSKAIIDQVGGVATYAPFNLTTTMQPLARQLAKDYYDCEMASLDLLLKGIYDWPLDTGHDIIWTLTADHSCTRVVRRAIDTAVSEFQHGCGSIYRTLACGEDSIGSIYNQGLLQVLGGDRPWRAGTATLTAGNTTVTVTFSSHLAGGNYAVVITPESNVTVNWKVGGKTTAHFVITISGTLGADLVFNWIAIAYN